MSVLSVAPQDSCRVWNVCLVPMISPSKNVVRVGWSSVSPVFWGRRLVIWTAQVHMRNRWHTLDSEIAAEVRLRHIDMFDLHIHIIYLTVRLLSSHELATGPK